MTTPIGLKPDATPSGIPPQAKEASSSSSISLEKKQDSEIRASAIPKPNENQKPPNIGANTCEVWGGGNRREPLPDPITKSSVARATNQAMNKPHATSSKTVNPPKIPPSKLDGISQSQLIKVLIFLNNRDKYYEFQSSAQEIYNKYGKDAFNPACLRFQIKKITDPELKANAMQLLFNYEMKSMGHNLSIGGKIKVEKKTSGFVKFLVTFFGGLFKSAILSWASSKNIKLEGMNSALSFNKLDNAVASFIKKEELKANPSETEQENLSDIREVKKAIGHGLELITNPKPNYTEVVNKIKNGELVTFVTGWHGHAVSIAIKGDMIAYSNRGQRIESMQSGIILYKINNMEGVTEQFIKTLLDKYNQSRELTDPKARMDFFEGSKRNNETDPKNMREILDLQVIGTIKKKNQRVGNCSWVGSKCSVEASLLLIKISNKMTKEGKTGIEDMRNAMKTARPNVKSLYRNFDAHHKNATLKYTLEDIIKSKEFKLLSQKDQFLLCSQILNRFMWKTNSTNPSNSNEEKAEIAKACQAIIEKTKQVPISDSIIVAKEFHADTTQKAVRIIVSRENESSNKQRSTTHYNPPGAFAIIEDSDGIKLHYWNTSVTSIELKKMKDGSDEYYIIEGSEKKYRTIGEISEFIQDKCKDDPSNPVDIIPYPITDINYIKEEQERIIITNGEAAFYASYKSI